MSYIGKNPKFDSQILKDQGVASVGNPAASSHKIVNRSGELFLKNSSGQESPLKSRAIADIATIKAIAATSRNNGDIVISLADNVLYLFDSGSAATGDDDFVLTPDAGSGRWLKIAPDAGNPINLTTDITGTLPIANGGTNGATKTAAFDNLSPTTTKGDLIVSDGTNNVREPVGADGLILKADSSTSSGVSWGSASSGSGEINYIDNPDAEANTTGWATYADAAGATPVDGIGGSPTVTWTRQSSVVLRGNQTFKLTKDAANRQGEGVSYDFTIKEQDISKKLKIQFDFKTNEDAAYASGDLTVYIYDVTNATLITPVDTDIIDGQNIFQTSFNSTTSTSYRLIFHIATTNASAWDAYIDNVIVGPGMTSQGAAIGPNYSQTIDNSNFANDAGLTIGGKVVWQRVGDSFYFNFLMYISGTGTDASALQFQPTTLTNFPSVTFTSGSYGAGLFRVDNSTAGDREPSTAIFSTDGTANLMFAVNNAGADLLGTQFGNAGTLFDQCSISATVKVVEYSGKGIVPMLAEDNLSEWQDYTPSNTQGFGTISNNQLQYRRVGDSLQLRGRFQAGTTIASPAQLELPSGLTIGGQTDRVIAGYLVRDANAGGDYMYTILATAGETYFTFGRTGSTRNGITEENGNGIAGTSEVVSLVTFSVPIQEWAGSQNSLVGYSLSSKDYAGLSPAGVFDNTESQAITLEERSTTPADPTSGENGRIYVKDDKLIIQFNDSGTVRYKYLDLTGTGVTWVHTTTAP